MRRRYTYRQDPDLTTFQLTAADDSAKLFVFKAPDVTQKVRWVHALRKLTLSDGEGGGGGEQNANFTIDLFSTRSQLRRVEASARRSSMAGINTDAYKL